MVKSSLTSTGDGESVDELNELMKIRKSKSSVEIYLIE
jgi:hypothetical protein